MSVSGQNIPRRTTEHSYVQQKCRNTKKPSNGIHAIPTAAIILNIHLLAIIWIKCITNLAVTGHSVCILQRSATSIERKMSQRKTIFFFFWLCLALLTFKCYMLARVALTLKHMHKAIEMAWHREYNNIIVVSTIRSRSDVCTLVGSCFIGCGR